MPRPCAGWRRADFTNAISIIALQWLALHRDRVRAAWVERPCHFTDSPTADSLAAMDIRNGFIDSDRQHAAHPAARRLGS